MHQRRRLEAQRLAAAGRQDDDAVAAGENRVHRLALQRAEAGEPPHAVEHVLRERDQRRAVSGVDVVIDEALERCRELVVGAAQRRDVLAVDEDGAVAAPRRCRAG